MAAEETSAVWWIEVIKVSPSLLGAAVVVGVLVVYRKEVRHLFKRMTKFSGLGLEAEFSDKTLDRAIAASTAKVGPDDKKGALRRLAEVEPLLRDTRILWLDNTPANNRNERLLLEGAGVRFTTVTNAADAQVELRDNIYLLMITNLTHDGEAANAIAFVQRLAKAGQGVPTIGYVNTDQFDKERPAHFFGITNRPDQLIHLVCDVAERERL